MRYPSLSLYLIVGFLGGCAGVGIVDTNDPYQKLENATVLYGKQGRPIAANRLMIEVIKTCEENNDRPCLARAWASYGGLLKSESAKAWEMEHGKGAFPADRYDQAAEYLGKAAIAFIELKDHGRATNAYHDQARAFELAGQKTEACTSWLKTFAEYKQFTKEYLAKNHDAKPYVPSGFSTYEEFIGTQRNRIGCP